MNFLTELSKRWKQDSPPFFKQMQKFGVWLVVTGGGLIGIPATLNVLIPDTNIDLSLLIKIAIQMIIVGAIIKIVAKTPVNDSRKIKEKI